MIAGTRRAGEAECGLGERGRTRAEMLAGKVVGKAEKVGGGGGGGRGGAEDSRGKKGGLMGEAGVRRADPASSER